MKKNISINISGIIFHIEEDGYDQLKNYLESINKYFATFEDSKEIIEDIENRIAEIFLSKLTDGNQVVLKENVDELIATMGSISDFEAAEEREEFGQKTSQEEPADKTSEGSQSKEKESASETFAGEKKLFRDTKRKLIGGVASGLAHYFNIDPLWIRLIILILVFNLVIFAPLGGLIIIAYIIMWIILPASESLREDKSMKKMFRNGDERVIGGVASGLAAYFGTDVTLIRILFIVATVLGFTGLILYIVLWIITPEAKTITDKIQMQGEPVTLSNIESSVKKSLNVEKDEEENLLVKILLFPFRLIAAVFTGLGKVLGPILLFIVELARVFAGIVILLTAIALIVALTFTFSVLLGIMAGGDYFYLGDDIPIDLIKASFPPFIIVAGYVCFLMPSLLFATLGASLVAKKKTLTATAGWTIFGIWVLSLFALGTNVPGIVRDFRADGEYRTERTFDLNGKTAVLDLHNVGMRDYHVTYLRIRAHDEPVYRLVQVFESRGRSHEDAIQNAQMVEYNVNQEDSVIYFDSNIRFNNDARFRAQQLRMTLYVPYDTPFVIDPDLRDILSNTLYPYGYSGYDLNGNTWMFTSSEGLTCLTCDDVSDRFGRGSGYQNQQIQFDYENFNEIVVGDDFVIELYRSDEYGITLSGRGIDLDNVSISQDNNTLEIDYDSHFSNDYDRAQMKIEIGMPHLESMNLGGASRAYIKDFNEDNVDIRISGSAYLEINISAQNLSMNLNGSSSVNLSGSGEDLVIDAGGASIFNSYDYQVRNVEIESSGAANVKVFASNNLEIDSGGASIVQYRGEANLNINENNESRIIRD